MVEYEKALVKVKSSANTPQEYSADEISYIEGGSILRMVGVKRISTSTGEEKVTDVMRWKDIPIHQVLSVEPDE